MSAVPIYQDLKYQDSNVYSVLDNVPRKQPQPSWNGPTLQDKPEAGIQKSSQDGQILREVKDLEKKLRLWRIIAATLFLLIIFGIILVVSIFLTQRNKQGTKNTGQQKLKVDICVNNAPSCTYCPRNWLYHSENCYFFLTDLLNWTDSRDNCRRMDSQLAVIKNRDEQKFVERTGIDLTWIGLSKAENGSLIWEDGTLLGESFWNPGEPNNNGGSERCVELQNVSFNSTGWNDNRCELQKRSLCKRPASVLSV